MTFYPPFGVPATDAPLESLSRCLFHLNLSRTEWDATTGALVAETGHTGVLTRAATATGTDSKGVTYTAQHNQPAYESRDWLNSSTRQSFGLLMGTSDKLPFAVNFLPQAMAGYAEFIEVAGATFCLSNAGVTGIRLVVDMSGGVYRVTHHNGTSSVTATLGAGPTAGQRVRLYWYLTTTGAVQIFQSINEAAYTSAGPSSALTIATPFAAPASVYVNSLGTGTSGAMWLRKIKYVAGNPALSVLQTLR